MTAARKDRVLIVDDDLGILQILLRALQDAFEVFVAPTGYDIETVIHHFKPDLMILDINMPDESGKDLCKSLRKRQEYNDTAILLLSGLAKPAVATAAIQAGADGYLTKPFDIFVLRKTIAHLIDVKRSGLPQFARRS